MGIYKFGNNTYPRRIRRRSNLGHIFQGKKCFLWAGKYSNYKELYDCKWDPMTLTNSTLYTAAFKSL